MDIAIRRRSVEFRNRQVTARIPHQSPIGSEEPIGDSFPPVEAILRFALDHPEGRPLY